jgi:hypothetical protein
MFELSSMLVVLPLQIACGKAEPTGLGIIET